MPSGPELARSSQVDHTKPDLENDTHQTAPAGNFWRDPRPTNKNPNFVRDYFQSSRLHFIGSFRARYESMMVAVGKRLKVHPSVLLRPPPKTKPTTERVIVHIDMDCFFASIAVTKNPKLRGKCIAICHGGGEISSCSYEARAYGVRAGMFCRNARKLCPDLVSVDYDFPSYEKVSIQIYSFFHDYPGICVEAVSVDEAYLDITQTVGEDASQSGADTLVTNLRNRIQMQTGCTASAGIGPSKLVARLATKGAKPNGQLRVRQENVIEYLDTLSVSDLPGIGWRTTKRLASLGVTTVRQLRDLSLIKLQKTFGERQGQVFHDLARALDSRLVEPMKPRKSIGAEASWGVRFEKDETDKVNKFIEDIAEEVATRVTEAGACGKKMTYKVYRRIPGSSMEGWKYLGHGPCTVLTKSTRLRPNCVGDMLKAVLKEKCLDIHKAWKIRNDEFRGVGLQMTDLVFADLSFNHLTVPVNGTRRIDTFFSVTHGKESSIPRASFKRTLCHDERTQTTEQGVETGKEHVGGAVQDSDHGTVRRVERTQMTTTDVKCTKEDAGHNVKDNEPICPKHEEGLPTQESKRATLFQRNAESVEADEIQPAPNAETEAETNAETHVPTGAVPIRSDLPDGWDVQVFEALPPELQTELLQVQNRVSTDKNALSSIPNNNEEKHLMAEPSQQRRPAKRKRDVRINRQAQHLEKKTKRKESAQITMTQCADISELRKTGHEVLDAGEFRDKPLREVVELLDDLKPRRRVVKLESGKGPTREKGNDDGEVDMMNSGRSVSSRKTDFDIPSPPSLSSDSESSYGVSGAIEKEGLEHSRIYVDEDIWTYASKLKAWMTSNASGIRTGHIELLRGRVLEMVYLKELDRACSELRVIRKYADEDGAETGGWKEVFNEVLAEVQNESVKLYGFRLGVRRLDTGQE